jgi:membrane-associated HD superfamily phosphohydrolase
VKEGIELADKFRLGKKIQEMIKQHHGTTLVNHFYNRAKELEDPQLYAVQEMDFRYMGPKPQTKEAGILMLADAVEAASRTLDNTTPRRIETLVQRVIENVFIDGQLDDCELTLKDLHAIQRSFTTILLGIFHHRIEYPERMENGGFDKRFPKIVRSGQGAGTKSNRRLVSLFGRRE